MWTEAIEWHTVVKVSVCSRDLPQSKPKPSSYQYIHYLLCVKHLQRSFKKNPLQSPTVALKISQICQLFLKGGYDGKLDISLILQ